MMDDKVLDLKKQIQELKRQTILLNKKVERLESLDRFHLMRIKNNDELSDQYILNGMEYLDLSPEKAYRIYNDIDKDFIVLDVSDKNYVPFKKLPESRFIPLEQLEDKVHEFTNKALCIFVISETGVRSILACKILNKAGFFNVNNISGGHKYWPGNHLSYDDHGFDDFLKEA